MAASSYKMQRLYLRVSPGTLSFAVYHPFGGKPPVVENYEVNPTASLNVNLKEALASLPLAQENFFIYVGKLPENCFVEDGEAMDIHDLRKFLKQNFSRAEVLLNVPYTLKPIELFNEEEAESIYHTSFYDSAHDRIFYDVAGNLGTALIYGISDAFCRVIDDNFQSVHFSSTTTAVANRFAEAARGSKRNTLYAYRHENMMDLFVFRAGRLQLGNRFTTIGVEDAAYYVMLAVKTLGMNVDEDEFNIIESANEEGSLTKRLHDFVNDVKQEEFRNAFGRTPLADAKNLTYDMAAFLMQPY